MPRASFLDTILGRPSQSYGQTSASASDRSQWASPRDLPNAPAQKNLLSGDMFRSSPGGPGGNRAGYGGSSEMGKSKGKSRASFFAPSRGGESFHTAPQAPLSVGGQSVETTRSSLFGLRRKKKLNARYSTVPSLSGPHASAYIPPPSTTAAGDESRSMAGYTDGGLYARKPPKKKWWNSLTRSSRAGSMVDGDMSGFSAASVGYANVKTWAAGSDNAAATLSHGGRAASVSGEYVPRSASSSTPKRPPLPPFERGVNGVVQPLKESADGAGMDRRASNSSIRTGAISTTGPVALGGSLVQAGPVKSISYKGDLAHGVEITTIKAVKGSAPMGETKKKKRKDKHAATTGEGLVSRTPSQVLPPTQPRSPTISPERSMSPLPPPPIEEEEEPEEAVDQRRPNFAMSRPLSPTFLAGATSPTPSGTATPRAASPPPVRAKSPSIGAVAFPSSPSASVYATLQPSLRSSNASLRSTARASASVLSAGGPSASPRPDWSSFMQSMSGTSVSKVWEGSNTAFLTPQPSNAERSKSLRERVAKDLQAEEEARRSTMIDAEPVDEEHAEASPRPVHHERNISDASSSTGTLERAANAVIGTPGVDRDGLDYGFASAQSTLPIGVLLRPGSLIPHPEGGSEAIEESENSEGSDRATEVGDPTPFDTTTADRPISPTTTERPMDPLPPLPPLIQRRLDQALPKPPPPDESAAQGDDGEEEAEALYEGGLQAVPTLDAVVEEDENDTMSVISASASQYSTQRRRALEQPHHDEMKANPNAGPAAAARRHAAFEAVLKKSASRSGVASAATGPADRSQMVVQPSPSENEAVPKPITPTQSTPPTPKHVLVVEDTDATPLASPKVDSESGQTNPKPLESPAIALRPALVRSASETPSTGSARSRQTGRAVSFREVKGLASSSIDPDGDEGDRESLRSDITPRSSRRISSRPGTLQRRLSDLSLGTGFAISAIINRVGRESITGSSRRLGRRTGSDGSRSGSDHSGSDSEDDEEIRTRARAEQERLRQMKVGEDFFGPSLGSMLETLQTRNWSDTTVDRLGLDVAGGANTSRMTAGQVVKMNAQQRTLEIRKKRQSLTFAGLDGGDTFTLDSALVGITPSLHAAVALLDQQDEDARAEKLREPEAEQAKPKELSELLPPVQSPAQRIASLFSKGTSEEVPAAPAEFIIETPHESTEASAAIPPGSVLSRGRPKKLSKDFTEGPAAPYAAASVSEAADEATRSTLPDFMLRKLQGRSSSSPRKASTSALDRTDSPKRSENLTSVPALTKSKDKPIPRKSAMKDASVGGGIKSLADTLFSFGTLKGAGELKEGSPLKAKKGKSARVAQPDLPGKSRDSVDSLVDRSMDSNSGSAATLESAAEPREVARSPMVALPRLKNASTMTEPVEDELDNDTAESSQLPAAATISSAAEPEKSYPPNGSTNMEVTTDQTGPLADSDAVTSRDGIITGPHILSGTMKEMDEKELLPIAAAPASLLLNPAPVPIARAISPVSAPSPSSELWSSEPSVVPSETSTAGTTFSPNAAAEASLLKVAEKHLPLPPPPVFERALPSSPDSVPSVAPVGINLIPPTPPALDHRKSFPAAVSRPPAGDLSDATLEEDEFDQEEPQPLPTLAATSRRGSATSLLSNGTSSDLHNGDSTPRRSKQKKLRHSRSLSNHSATLSLDPSNLAGQGAGDAALARRRTSFSDGRATLSPTSSKQPPVPPKDLRASALAQLAGRSASPVPAGSGSGSLAGSNSGGSAGQDELGSPASTRTHQRTAVQAPMMTAINAWESSASSSAFYATRNAKGGGDSILSGLHRLSMPPRSESPFAIAAAAGDPSNFGSPAASVRRSASRPSSMYDGTSAGPSPLSEEFRVTLPLGAPVGVPSADTLGAGSIVSPSLTRRQSIISSSTALSTEDAFSPSASLAPSRSIMSLQTPPTSVLYRPAKRASISATDALSTRTTMNTVAVTSSNSGGLNGGDRGGAQGVRRMRSSVVRTSGTSSEVSSLTPSRHRPASIDLSRTDFSSSIIDEDVPAHLRGEIGLTTMALTGHTPPPRKLGPTGILVQVIAVAIDALDRQILRDKVRSESGAYGFVPGRSFCGRVIECGWEVKGLRKGDTIFGLQDSRKCGALAEYMIVDHNLVARAPEGSSLSSEQIAALPAAGVLAYQILRGYVAPLARGSRVLILDAHDGVGLIIMQESSGLGLIIVAQCPPDVPDAFAVCQANGAHEVVVAEPLWALNSLHESSFDLVIDTIGGRRIYDASRRILATDGQFTTCVGDDDHSVANPSLKSHFRSLRRAFFKKDKKHIGYEWIGSDAGEDCREALDAVRGAAERGEVTPRVASVLAMEDAPRAFENVLRTGAGGSAVDAGAVVVRIS